METARTIPRTPIQLTVLLAAGELAKGIDTRRRQSPLADHTHLQFLDYRRELSGTGDALQLDQVPEVMGKCWGQISLDVNACGRVLDEEIRSRNVVGDDSSDLYGITPSRLFRTQLPDLTCVG